MAIQLKERERVIEHPPYAGRDGHGSPNIPDDNHGDRWGSGEGWRGILLFGISLLISGSTTGIVSSYKFLQGDKDMIYGIICALGLAAGGIKFGKDGLDLYRRYREKRG